ncbi:MAG: sugar ABC transporter substrate-binding protein [bacterium]|uniref:ABC transporter substrate-binding protein n=1 Tax=Gemmiger sp. TaxID=2049027 RepID=UPI002A7F52BB|nr:sugar ABC transporter substrate-binding protein [Gemmiger sp.]MCI6176695.1 sugar ABC transporter substrate-binding protein [bacterium]MCI7192292.1 sugar ABC transporter substrate-binding protein [bacterium]MDD6717910.1 sugar ABC transporter substrate-binding protein [bacterium]MDY4447533.1 sugar ABC transporter substrate-binding protein [Gemmiger sp.]
MKNMKRMAAGLLAAGMAAGLVGCGGGNQSGAAADGNVNLTFQIWDVAQRDGMQAMCDAYTAQHPNVKIEVQVTSWNEYWTKLEAAATSGQMPDIFWMHTNELLKYADNGMLADCSDIVDTSKFSEVSLSNASGSDGTLYAVPKDKDTVGLVYNKEMFDAAGVSYPDESWTWDDLTDASQKIYDATGKYGYMAYGDDQLGYWNFVYQNGGYILNEDKTQAGFTQPATAEAMKFYIGLQQYDWCPDQNYFAETAPGTAFFSEKGAMFFEGDWNILAELQNYPEMQGKWDVAVLPKAPNPVNGDGRATISNGLSYATAANNKNLDTVKDVLKFFGSEEGQRIQGESGAAIPAYIGLEETFLGVFEEYDINMQVFLDMFDYSIQSVNNASRPEWKSKVNDELLKMYAGTVDIDTGLQNMQNIVDAASAG